MLTGDIRVMVQDEGDVFLEELSRDRVEAGRFKDGAIDIVGLRQREILPKRSSGKTSGLAAHR